MRIFRLRYARILRISMCRRGDGPGQFQRISQMSDFLNADDLKTYTAYQVATLAGIDCHAVIEEGIRRQNAAEKKIARLRKQMEAARAELEGAVEILTAGFQAREAR